MTKLLGNHVLGLKRKKMSMNYIVVIKDVYFRTIREK